MTNPRVTGTKVHVRGLRVEAEIGVYPHEYGRRQPLVIDVELALEPGQGPFEHLADILNYETVIDRARSLAAEGHVKLVEAFAEKLARAYLSDPRVLSARIRVDKPEALAPATAGVEIMLERV
jgi:dihydroneopterin aldolase